MATRNFWISANIDGRKTPLTGGPRAKDGGFDLTIYQRDSGGIVMAASIHGFALDDGTLKIRYEIDKGKEIIRETKR